MRRWIALLVALAMVGGGVAVPVVADAAPAKSAKAKAKAKKKKAKKKKRKKAARTAPAQGTAGPQGPAGPAGPPGTSVVARARLSAPMTITSSEMVKVPLTGSKWTQQADETDDFVAEATVTLPAECTAPEPGPMDSPIFWAESQVYGYEFVGGGFGDLKLGDEYLGFVDFPVFAEDAGKTITQSFHIDRKLMEPGTPTDRELTFEFSRYCEGEGQDFKVEALKVNVIGIREQRGCRPPCQPPAASRPSGY